MANMTSPVRIVASRSARAAAGHLADAVAALGTEVSLPRLGRPRPGDWVAADRGSVPGGEPEAVLVSDEDERGMVETARPELIGRVWVLRPEDAGALAAVLVERLRPVTAVMPTTIGVTGYNQKFFRPIAAHLARITGVHVLIDEWPRYSSQLPEQTDEVLGRSDVVVAEWCGPNAVYASRNKRADQRLVVRLHRFELERDDWADVDIAAVDTVVTVGPHYRRLVLEKTGWPEEKVVVIPNGVDLAQYDRPKTEDAARTVGLLGAIPWRKRPDRALDIVEAAGPEWRLSIKSATPDTEPWTWRDDAYRTRFESLLARVDTSPQARWVNASPCVADWFRGIGTILSVSDDESFHLAPAEGMASGTVPVVWNWPGADEVYLPHRIVGDLQAAVGAVVAPVRPDEVRAEVARYDLRSVLEAWRTTLFDR